MNIVVCIKQVPDTTEVRVDPETNALVREGVKSITNPFDENAIEAALQLREQHGGKVTVITMGPGQAESALRDAIAMGADEAILISDAAFRGSDTLATSYVLAQAVRKIGAFDLILCGKQAIDGDTAQVGPGLAERLGIPQVTFAIELSVENGKLRARRVLESGFEVVEVKPPALVTVVKQINEPRYPGMKGVLRARKAPIVRWDAAAIGTDPRFAGFDGSPTWVVRVFPPERRAKGERIQADAETAAKRLAEVIEGMHLSP
jgi:electron transfer flavoprotein beta subunit